MSFESPMPPAGGPRSSADGPSRPRRAPKLLALSQESPAIRSMWLAGKPLAEILSMLADHHIAVSARTMRRFIAKRGFASEALQAIGPKSLEPAPVAHRPAMPVLPTFPSSTHADDLRVEQALTEARRATMRAVTLATPHKEGDRKSVV